MRLEEVFLMVYRTAAVARSHIFIVLSAHVAIRFASGEKHTSAYLWLIFYSNLKAATSQIAMEPSLAEMAASAPLPENSTLYKTVFLSPKTACFSCPELKSQNLTEIF